MFIYQTTFIRMRPIYLTSLIDQISLQKIQHKYRKKIHTNTWAQMEKIYEKLNSHLLKS